MLNQNIQVLKHLLLLIPILFIASCKKDLNTQVQLNGSICYQKIEKVMNSQGGKMMYTFSLLPCDTTSPYYMFQKATIDMYPVTTYEVIPGTSQVVTKNTPVINIIVGYTNYTGVMGDSILNNIAYKINPLSAGTAINDNAGSFADALHLNTGANNNIYIGFRTPNFYSNGNSYYNYGWMKISYTADLKTFTIHECAINTNPDEVILAGQY